ncbi:MAG: phosphoribosylformylglycinamidine synthase II, partial [Demequinaceae bacterium]|nr:phosphoribosylformylglycinamidine synthase II [Demequinaceae bacterium]
RPYARPAWMDGLQADTAASLPMPADGDALRATTLEMLGSPTLSSRGWVTSQYDRYVQGNTAMARPDVVGVVRVDEATGRGVAIATRSNDRYTKLDPYAGAEQAVVAAYRAVAVAGAEPRAVTDGLNFGSPEDPDSMWQFAEAVRGIADACLALGVPVTGGNVSLYNGTGKPGQIDSSINPTPIVGILGVFDDVRRATPAGWREAGQSLYLVGATRAELDGSVFAQVAGHLGGLPPAVDFEAEMLLAEIMVSASRDGLADAAREVTEGGLATAVAMGALRYGLGARIVLDEVVARDGVTPAQAWLSESQGRVLVAVPRTEEQRWADMLTARGVPFARVGVTQEEPTIEVQGQFTLPLAELRDTWEATLPSHFA